MPKYNLKCTVIRKGEELTGPGIELPKETGDRLVARGLATQEASDKKENKKENKKDGGDAGDKKSDKDEA